jgi:hypothetical protein
MDGIEETFGHGITIGGSGLTVEEELLKLGLWPEEFSEALEMDKHFSVEELQTMAKEKDLLTHDGEKGDLIAALIIRKRSEGRVFEDKPVSEKSVTELKSSILLFASQHGIAIGPAKDLNGYCLRAVRMEHCVCVDSRLYCPCPEALGEVESTGHCACNLFIRRDLYATALKTARYYWEKKYGPAPAKGKRTTNVEKEARDFRKERGR